MKRIGILLMLVWLTSCKKERLGVLPPETRDTLLVRPGNRDTIPDKAAIGIKLSRDSINYDETMIVFNHQASAAYNSNEDAAYFQGFGQVSLATVSADGRSLAINSLPFTHGMAVGLDVKMKNDGAFTLVLSYQKNIPSSIVIWLKDRFVRDSVNIMAGPYLFTVQKADTNSFGRNRFSLVIQN
jgi:hypothetical protein